MIPTSPMKKPAPKTEATVIEALRILPEAARREVIERVINSRPADDGPRIVKLSGIFVAAQSEFEVQMSCAVTEARLLDILFRDLPLHENGWDRMTLGTAELSSHCWRLWRT